MQQRKEGCTAGGPGEHLSFCLLQCKGWSGASSCSSPQGVHNPAKSSWRKGGDGSSTADLLARPGKGCQAAAGSQESHVPPRVGHAAKAGVADRKHSEGCGKAASERGQNASRHGKR